MVITSCLKNNLIEKKELQHIGYDAATGKYHVLQLHLSLVNSAFAQNDLMKIHGRKDFNSTEIVANDLDSLKFEDFTAQTIEISTRFHYDDVTGMYLS